MRFPVPRRESILSPAPAGGLPLGRMARLVFDIETSALGLEGFDEAQIEYLFRESERQPDETAKALKRAEIQQQFSLWPFTAQIVCVAMVNADTGRGQVLYQSDDFDEETVEENAAVEFAPKWMRPSCSPLSGMSPGAMTRSSRSMDAGSTFRSYTSDRRC